MTESDSARRRRRQPADAGDDFFESLYRPEPRVERRPGDEPDASPAAEPTTSEPDAVRPAQAAPASPERAGQPAARPEPAEDDPDDTLRQPAVAGRAAPAPAEEGARPAARPAVLASVTVVLTAVVFLGWYLLLGPGRPAGVEANVVRDPVAAQRTGGATVPSGRGVGVSAPGRSTTSPARGAEVPPPEAAPSSEEGAVHELRRVSASDMAGLTFDDRFVAQLASKWSGIEDPLQVNAAGEHTFSARDILAEHRELRASTTGATVRLLDSTRYGIHRSHDGRPYWMTVASSPTFTSADAVRAWCAQQFPSLPAAKLANRCIPNRLTPPGP